MLVSARTVPRRHRGRSARLRSAGVGADRECGRGTVGRHRPGRVPGLGADCGRGHLEQVLGVYIQHDNRHRPHRALQLEAPDRPARLTVVGENERGGVRRGDLLGGLPHEYRRAA